MPPLASRLQTNSQTALWLYTACKLKSSLDANMVGHCDRNQGSALDIASPPIHPLNILHIPPHTHTQIPHETCHCSSMKSSTKPSQCLSYCLFPLYFSHGANKAWIRLWDRNQELCIAATIKLSGAVSCRCTCKTTSMKFTKRIGKKSETTGFFKNNIKRVFVTNW